MRVEQVVFSMGVEQRLRSVVLLMVLTFLMLFGWLVQTGAMGGAMSGGVCAGRFLENRSTARIRREDSSVIQVWITIV